MEENIKNIETENKKKKGKASTIIVTLMVIGALGLLGYKVWNSVRPLTSYISDKSDRNFVYIDAEKEKKDVLSHTDGDAAEEELNRTPYSESGVGGGLSVWVSGTGSVTIGDFIQNGEVVAGLSGASLRCVEDDKVSQNEEYNFNQYVSYRKSIDNISNEKLSKEQVNVYADKLKSLAQKESHPAWLYIDKLVNNQEGKNPTKSSLIYLALANGLSNEGVANIFDINLGYVNDYSNLLDRSFVPTQERGLTRTYSGNLEVVNEETAILHANTDSAYTYWAIVDSVTHWSNTYTTDKNLDNEIVIAIKHYKDISNDFIAEFYSMIINKDTSELEVNRAYFTKNKPTFKWSISPKIEEIASAYYDIVEPAVYAGKYTNFTDAYKSTYDALEGKYTLEEIESAVMTYEFWALCNYD